MEARQQQKQHKTFNIDPQATRHKRWEVVKMRCHALLCKRRDTVSVLREGSVADASVASAASEITCTPDVAVEPVVKLPWPEPVLVSKMSGVVRECCNGSAVRQIQCHDCH
jgi:hypothetical protein